MRTPTSTWPLKRMRSSGSLGLGARIGCGLADVVEQRSPGERGGCAGRELFEQQHGVGPDVAFGMELGRLLDAVHADCFGQDVREQAELRRAARSRGGRGLR